jgi:ParB-like chromosome segregation protein Spo0J
VKLPVSDIKPNPTNPRTIKDENFKKLVQSIKDFPELLDARPLILNKDHIILGGNMRFKAAKEAGLTEVPVKIVDWSEEKQREFIIKDNVSGGEWDWDVLANEWDTEQLDEWGLDVPEIPDFEPASEDEQGKLDEKKKIECPECGHEFET